MKKTALLLALTLTIALLFTGCTSPEAAQQFSMMMSYRDNKIGDVTLSPMMENGEPLPCGINVIRFVFERQGIVPREGTLTVYNYDDDTVYREFTITPDSEYDNMNIFTDQNSSNTIIEFGLGGMFEAGHKYYFEASEGLFGVEGEGYENISSPAYGGKDEWYVEIAPYGISGFEGTLKEVGDTRTYDVVIGGEVTRVEVEEAEDDVVTIEPETLTESGTVTVTVNNTGSSIVRFSFYNDYDEAVEKLESGVLVEAEE